MDVIFISFHCLLLHDLCNFRVLWKDFFMQKLLSDSHCLYILEHNIEKLRALLVENVVIANYNGRVEMIFELFANLMLCLLTLQIVIANTHQVIAHSNVSLKDKIHL